MVLFKVVQYQLPAQCQIGYALVVLSRVVGYQLLRAHLNWLVCNFAVIEFVQLSVFTQSLVVAYRNKSVKFLDQFRLPTESEPFSVSCVTNELTFLFAVIMRRRRRKVDVFVRRKFWSGITILTAHT